MIVEQLSFFEVETSNSINTKKRIHYEIPTYNKPEKIKEDLKEWNTIKHVYRYQTLYKICNKLFMQTYNNKLKCLTYYVEDIDNFMYAVDESLSALSLKERILKHIELLRKVYNHDSSLEYDNNKKSVSEVVTLFN